MSNIKQQSNLLSKQIIGAAIEVHKTIGPGLLESVYETCLCRELQLRGIPFERQHPFYIEYKGEKLDGNYRADILVDNLVIVELKAVDQLLPIHEAQVITYLRLTKKWLGLLINFNTPLLKDGIKRFVN